MNRFDLGVKQAKEQMMSAGEMPRQIMPDRQHIETDGFFADIFWSATNGGEYVAKLTYKNPHLGGIEEVRTPSRDAMILELMRQNGDLTIEEQKLLALPTPKVRMLLKDFDSPEHLLRSVEESATARAWIENTPQGRAYTRLAKVSSSDQCYEILKKEMIVLGFWDKSELFTEANFSFAFINALDAGKFGYFEELADRQESQAAMTQAEDAPEFQEDAAGPFMHVNRAANETGVEDLRAVKELPFKELRRRAVAERYASKRSYQQTGEEGNGKRIRQ